MERVIFGSSIMRCFTIISIIITVLLSACASLSVNDVSSSLKLTPAVDLSRARTIVISPLSHVGIYIDHDRIRADKMNASHPLLEPRLNDLSKGTMLALESIFADVTSLDKPKSVIWTMDFIVHAQVMKMTLLEETITETPDTGVFSDSAVKEPEVQLPTDYLSIKLLLKDARSQKVIDVAYLDSRSGQLDYRKGYAVFAEHSMRHYLNKITP